MNQGRFHFEDIMLRFFLRCAHLREDLLRIKIGNCLLQNAAAYEIRMFGEGQEHGAEAKSIDISRYAVAALPNFMNDGRREKASFTGAGCLEAMLNVQGCIFG